LVPKDHATLTNSLAVGLARQQEHDEPIHAGITLFDGDAARLSLHVPKAAKRLHTDSNGNPGLAQHQVECSEVPGLACRILEAGLPAARSDRGPEGRQKVNLRSIPHSAGDRKELNA
jgi:hypothetical protein